MVVFIMTNVIAQNRSANSLLQQIGMRFLAGVPYPSIPEVVDLDEAAFKALAGTYRLPGDGGGFVLTADGQTLFIEAEGQKAFDSTQLHPAGRAGSPRDAQSPDWPNRRRQ